MKHRFFRNTNRHCEERSDEAIQKKSTSMPDRFTYVRNDAPHSRFSSPRLLAMTLTLGFALLALGSCLKDTTWIDHGDGDDGKVRIELFAKVPDYTAPVTRTGAAQENKIDMTPWVLVFKGSDDTAVYVEAAQAIDLSGKRYVTLTAQSDPCRLLILANPQAKFTTAAGTQYDFSVANFDAVLKPGGVPRTIAAACGDLLTLPLASPQQEVPFTALDGDGLVPRLPMSYMHPVAKIEKNTKICGSGDSSLEMVRAVAKVVVSNEADGFTLLGATVVNAPVRGALHRLDGAAILDNSAAGKLTDYMAAAPNEVTGIAAAAGAGAGKQSTVTATVENPIYLYESRIAENTAVVIKATYRDGKEYYYKLSFIQDNVNKTPLNVLRNHVYAFNIEEVNRPGFSTIADAVAAKPSNEDIVWSILVSDAYAHDITDNGEYYLGVTNSEYIVYADGAQSGKSAFTITTDRETALSDNFIKVSAGLTLVSPVPDAYGVGVIKVAAGVSVTEVRVSMTAGFTAGTVQLRLGNLEKTVTVEKRPAIEGALPYMQFTGDYVSAEVAEGNWLSVSPDGKNKAGDYISTKSGTVYLIPELNYGILGVAKSGGIVYLSRRDNSGGRVKLDIAQKVAPITASSMDGLPYPYVGTFHRASEVGERCVRIPTGTGNTGAWSARVIAGEDFIVLENGFRDGAVWPYENENAELYPLLGSATEVSGTIAAITEEIRFRVGMKSQLSTANPDWTTAPRYGLVLVTYGGTVSPKYWMLYIRQGEAADNLMRNGDYGAGDLNSSSRPNAKKFSPYNLTAPAIKNGTNTGGPLVSNHPQLPAAAASRVPVVDYFADYPSQAGAYFQWAVSATATNHIRRAYYPANYTFTSNGGSITGDHWFVGGSGSLYWNALSATNETCPNGYRRPNDGSISALNTATFGLAESELRQSLMLGPKSSVSSFYVSDNYKYGYYADGFFDRRQITTPTVESSATNSVVADNTGKVAYMGGLFFNPYNNASIFFPSAGQLYSGTGSRRFSGGEGCSWTSSKIFHEDSTTMQWAFLITYSTFAGITTNSEFFGFPIRCVAN